MKKSLFDKLYGACETAVKVMQKPVRIRMIKRAAERVGDDLESKSIELALKREKLELSLANAVNEDDAISIFKQLANLEREEEEAEALVEAVHRQAVKMFAEFDVEDEAEQAK